MGSGRSSSKAAPENLSYCAGLDFLAAGDILFVDLGKAGDMKLKMRRV